jgi:putative hydrolase of the HAD superfamily
MTKAVLFDLDGTLYDRDALVQELVADQHAAFEVELDGVSRERFVGRVLEMDDHGYGNKALGYKQLVQEWRLAGTLTDRLYDYFRSNYDRYCHLPADTASTLQALRAQDRTLGVITNGGTERQQAKLRALGLEDAFDVVLISEAEGVRKPSPEIFQRALRRHGIESSAAMFIGDHPLMDVEGARSAGLLPVWKYVPYWTLRTPNVATVHRLTDILPICLAP